MDTRITERINQLAMVVIAAVMVQCERWSADMWLLNIYMIGGLISAAFMMFMGIFFDESDDPVLMISVIMFFTWPFVWTIALLKVIKENLYE